MRGPQSLTLFPHAALFGLVVVHRTANGDGLDRGAGQGHAFNEARGDGGADDGAADLEGFDRGGDAHVRRGAVAAEGVVGGDRKSTRLNSSHANISYAAFCL